MALAGRPVVLYDADCGFCSRVARGLPRLGTAARIQPLQSADLDALGVDRARAEQELAVVLGSGEVRWGHRAVAAILRDLRRPWSWLGTVLDAAPLAPLAGWGYRVVARNRHRLPGGTPTCELPRQRG